MKYWSGTRITSLKPDYVFVFGSNPSGIHGKGAAKDAMKFGAVYGKGRGLYGQTYALVTKNLKKGFVEKLSNDDSITYERYGRRSVSLEMIHNNIAEMYDCCNEHPEKKFFVVYQNSADNLNGYSSDEMFKVFMDFSKIPDNIYFHNSFKEK